MYLSSFLSFCVNLCTNSKIICYLEYATPIFQILATFTITKNVRERIKMCLPRDLELIKANSMLDTLFLNALNGAFPQSFRKELNG